jgi:hypothetical protein
VLAAHHSAGIQKKAKRGRKSQLSAKAKRRQERGLDMAEAVAERTHTKLQRSLGRSRVVNDRRKAWDEINSKLTDGLEGAAADNGEDGPADSKEWGTDEDVSDVDGDKNIEDAGADANGQKPAEDLAQNDSGFLPVDVDGDEIL